MMMIMVVVVMMMITTYEDFLNDLTHHLVLLECNHIRAYQHSNVPWMGIHASLV